MTDTDILCAEWEGFQPIQEFKPMTDAEFLSLFDLEMKEPPVEPLPVDQKMGWSEWVRANSIYDKGRKYGNAKDPRHIAYMKEARERYEQYINPKKSKKLSHEEFLYDQCPELYKIMENFNVTVASSIPSNGSSPSSKRPTWIESLKDKYTVIKGHVQSGKTNFMICASALFVSMGYNVIHLLRDRTSDRDQIHERLVHFQENYNKEFGQKMRVIKTAGKGASENPQIYLTLCNKPSIDKVMSIITLSDRPYILFIDEVDFVDSGDATKKYEAIQQMKKGAYCVFGVSATIMDPIGKETIASKNIILLGTTSKHGVYKGIDRIQLLEIDKMCKYTGTVKGELCNQDRELDDFIDEFDRRQPIRYMASTYPNICLVNICRTKGPCFKLQKELGKKHPSLVTIVYNGDGISFQQGKTVLKERTTISKYLQHLKDNGGVETFPNIMIFAGDLAGRCISFVSEDYKWHLTDQRLLISSSCDEPELIQKIRLCGVYNDDIPLRLYTTKKTIDDLRKAYLRQEEIICALKEKEVENVRQAIESMEMNKEKFGRRSMTKDEKADIKMIKVDTDIGWDIDTYKMVSEDGSYLPKALPPPIYFEKYGQKAPSAEEYKMYEKEEKEEKEGTIYVDISHVNAQTKDTFERVCEYFEENHLSGWNERSKIAKYLVDTLNCDLELAHSRLQKVINKGTSNPTETGLAFRLNGGRWLVKKC